MSKDDISQYPQLKSCAYFYSWEQNSYIGHRYTHGAIPPADPIPSIAGLALHSVGYIDRSGCRASAEQLVFVNAFCWFQRPNKCEISFRNRVIVVNLANWLTFKARVCCCLAGRGVFTEVSCHWLITEL